MSKKLLIVESPAKVKTIGKVLGKDYTVLASYGHVRDLPPKDGSVDTTADFAMRYETIERNSKYVEQIAKAAREADEILLATDLDREGEAISWHIAEILRSKKATRDKPMQRVTFAEITPKAILEAIRHPRPLSMDLVNAQQARRALDYLVGFNLSPLLWRKVQRGLSAGRVQSPALRMIVEREEEIERFVPREYWTLQAGLNQHGAAFHAKLSQYHGSKLGQFDLNEGVSANAARDELLGLAKRQGKGPLGALKVVDIQAKDRQRRPAAPFITSTLQQEASRKLGFGTQRTMRVAQALYEGIAIDSGQVGLITYMRTDSVHLSQDALADIRSQIAKQYGPALLPATANEYKTKAKNAQEAHEAIRPSSAERTPAAMRRYLNDDQAALYELIWKRTVASQMKPALLNTVSVDLECGTGNLFRASGTTVVEPGFLLVYEEGRDAKSEDDDSGRMLPALTLGELIPLETLTADQHFTEPSPRFGEATLVKAMEEFGIGRPSTYASIIQVLLAREYVTLDSRRFLPTDIGRVVAKFLSGHFSQYVDYEFTARLEDELDAVARGEEDWVPVLRRFWQPFKQLIDEKTESVSRAEASSARVLGVHPENGKEISVRLGRYGPFAQIGSKDDEDKPKFASLRPGQKMDALSIAEALELFKLPRTLGLDAEGRDITVAIGRFGPFIKIGSSYTSLAKSDDPYTIELPRALTLVSEKAQTIAARTIKTFNDGAIQVIQGKYGPYITDGKRNGKIPKDVEPESLSLEACMLALDAAPGKKRPTRAQAASGATARAKRDVAMRSGKPAKAPAKPRATKSAEVLVGIETVTVKKAAARKPAAKKPATAKKPAAKKPAVKKPAAKAKAPAKPARRAAPLKQPMEVA